MILMFFINETEVCNFADDATIYSCSLNYQEAHRKLSSDTYVVLNCFHVNSMVANPGKFQIMFPGSLINNSNITFIVENKHIKSTNEVKLMGIIINHKLTFTKHINNLCITASNHLRALTRIRKFLSQEQTKRLSESYIMSTFKYCPLIWEFCGKTEKIHINKIHKRILRLIYDTEDSTFEDLLVILLVKIYKSIHYISPPIFKRIFST